MHCQIHVVRRQAIFNLFREHALCADFGQRNVNNLVPGGVDDLDFDVMPALAQQHSNMVGLPERQLGASRTDPQAQTLAPAPIVVPEALVFPQHN
jgi:hypothetical protein